MSGTDQPTSGLKAKSDSIAKDILLYGSATIVLSTLLGGLVAFLKYMGVVVPIALIAIGILASWQILTQQLRIPNMLIAIGTIGLAFSWVGMSVIQAVSLIVFGLSEEHVETTMLGVSIHVVSMVLFIFAGTLMGILSMAATLAAMTFDLPRRYRVLNERIGQAG